MGLRGYALSSMSGWLENIVGHPWSERGARDSSIDRWTLKVVTPTFVLKNIRLPSVLSKGVVVGICARWASHWEGLPVMPLGSAGGVSKV